MNILIHGVGKTGTTALFYAIRQALSGNVAELFEPGQPALDAALSASPEHVLAKVLLREMIQIPYERFPSKIMIVRDPRDTLVSRLLYAVWHAGFRPDPSCMEAYLTLLRVKERDPGSIPLKDLFSSFGAFQRQHPHRDYLQLLVGLARQQELLASRSDFFLLRYEDFVDGNLQNLSRYLGGLDLDHRVTVDAEVSRVERRKKHGDWRHWFTPEDVAFFRPLLTPAMHALGYGDDWELCAVPTIDPRYCSEYAARLSAERNAITKTYWQDAPVSHAELPAFGPEELLRLTGAVLNWASVPGVSATPAGPERLAPWASSEPQYLIEWAGGPIAGDFGFEFHLDAGIVDPVTRLSLDFGEGFSEQMSLILPATRGPNLVLIRFHKPVTSLLVYPVGSVRGFSVRDPQLRILA